MKKAQQHRIEEQIQSSAMKIEGINKKLVYVKETTTTSSKETDLHDWSARYNFWSSWEDVEELNETISNEKTKLDSLKEGSSFMGHYHDHSEGMIGCMIV